jgi:hypothetical protein
VRCLEGTWIIARGLVREPENGGKEGRMSHSTGGETPYIHAKHWGYTNMWLRAYSCANHNERKLWNRNRARTRPWERSPRETRQKRKVDGCVSLPFHNADKRFILQQSVSVSALWKGNISFSPDGIPLMKVSKELSAEELSAEKLSPDRWTAWTGFFCGWLRRRPMICPSSCALQSWSYKKVY